MSKTRQYAMPGVEHPEGTEFGVFILGKWVATSVIKDGEVKKLIPMSKVFDKLRKGLEG